MSKYQIIYDTTLTYPGFQANKLQTILMADGFSKFCDTTLFVKKLNKSESEIFRLYGLKDSNLKFKQIRVLNYFKSLKNNHGKVFPLLKFLTTNSKNKKYKKILYARRPNELISWASARKKYSELRDWKFVYELHDFNEWHNEDYSLSTYDMNSFMHFKNIEKYLNLLNNFDLIITASRRISIDLPIYSKNKITPRLVEHASAISSVPQKILNEPSLDKNKIKIGYIGSVDSYRGLDLIIESLPKLNPNISFHFNGNFLKETFSKKIIKIFEEQIKKGRVIFDEYTPIYKLKNKIINYDYMLISSSNDMVAKYYCSPLKFYDYLACDKKVIMPSSLAYTEICNLNNYEPYYYNHTSAKSFISCVNNLEKTEQSPTEENKIMNYKERAEKIINLVNTT